MCRDLESAHVMSLIVRVVVEAHKTRQYCLLGKEENERLLEPKVRI